MFETASVTADSTRPLITTRQPSTASVRAIARADALAGTGDESELAF